MSVIWVEFEITNDEDTCPHCKHKQFESDGEYCLRCGYNLMEDYMPRTDEVLGGLC